MGRELPGFPPQVRTSQNWGVLVSVIDTYYRTWSNFGWFYVSLENKFRISIYMKHIICAQLKQTLHTLSPIISTGHFLIESWLNELLEVWMAQDLRNNPQHLYTVNLWYRIHIIRSTLLNYFFLQPICVNIWNKAWSVKDDLALVWE